MRIIFTLFGIISIFYQFRQVVTQTTIDFGLEEGCGDGCNKGYKGEAGGCVPCPLGQYQNETSQTTCKECPAGKTTLITTGTSDTLCIDDCGLGKEYIIKSNTCEVCPIGFYKDATMITCFKCPDGQTTKDFGSNSCVTSYESPGTTGTRTTFTIDTVFNLLGGCGGNTGQIIGLIQGILREAIQAQAYLYVGICSKVNCANVVTTVKLCTDVNPSRKKRGANEPPAPERAEATTVVSDVPVEVSSTNAATRETERVLEEALYDRTMFEERLNDNELTFEGIKSITKTQACQDGQQYLQNNTCVDCPAGTYYDTVGIKCIDCERGYYQSSTKQLNCSKCPGVESTDSTGSKSETACKSGSSSNNNIGAGIGIGLGIAVALVVMVIVTVVIYRYRTGKRQNKETTYGSTDDRARVDDTQTYEELNVYSVPDTASTPSEDDRPYAALNIVETVNID